MLVDTPPFLFSDSLAARLLGDRAEELLLCHRLHGTHPILAGTRAEAVCRSRFTVARPMRDNSGIDQYAIPRCRTRFVRVSDHVATIPGVRGRPPGDPGGQTGTAAVTEPASVTFVPVDFEADSLRERLVQSGLDPFRPVFVSWLGVTGYLTRTAIAPTLREPGGLAPGSEIVTDHRLPAELRDAAGNGYAEAVEPVADGQGEP